MERDRAEMGYIRERPAGTVMIHYITLSAYKHVVYLSLGIVLKLMYSIIINVYVLMYRCLGSMYIMIIQYFEIDIVCILRFLWCLHSQCAVRCWLAKSEADYRRKQLCNAVLIQAAWRGYVEQKRYILLKQAAIIFQAYWRGKLTRRRCRHWFDISSIYTDMYTCYCYTPGRRKYRPHNLI